ncbi:hypothetical protein [uncultured Desulfobacter sp.]|nr:hypothetical protein [uncultured Desulfobacter sp.]
MSSTDNYATFKETYETGKIIAGNHAKDFNRSLLFTPWRIRCRA